MDEKIEIALIIRLEEIKDHMQDDFFKEYAVIEIENLINEIRAGNVVPF